MPKIYVRTQPRTGLKTRHRAGMAFTDTWSEGIDVDDATRDALEEDPYLEVSENPTELVEVAAALIDAENLNNQAESTTKLADSSDGLSDHEGNGETTESAGDVERAVEEPAAEQAVEEPTAEQAVEESTAEPVVKKSKKAAE